jgi:hypothetical protein
MRIVPAEESRALSWLHEAWHKQANKIDSLSRRWADLKLKGKLSPSFLHKLTRMLDQIAFLKRKERDVVGEIEAMEKKHQALRAQNKLRAAPKAAPQDNIREDYEQKPKLGFFGTLLWLMMLQKILGQNRNELQKPTIR